MIRIRSANIKDINQITKIYNYAILKTVATFDTEPKKIDEMRQWFKYHETKKPIIVAENDKKIIGWAALSKYDKKEAYSKTAELSLYVLEEFQKQGIGKKLMNAILKRGKQVGFHTVIARITEGNKISVHLHKKFGFKHTGILKEVGFKFGKKLDAHIMQKIYEK